MCLRMARRISNMNMRHRIATIINRIAKPFGVQVNGLNSNVTMPRALENIRKRGYSPSSIIDIGASNGKWSMVGHGVFPDAHFLLIEPLAENRAAISELVQTHKNWHYCHKAAGNEAGTVWINVAEDLDGSAVVFEHPLSDTVKQFPMTRVDSVCQDIGLPAPYLVKLDTHGFEVPILEGMKGIWNKIDFLIIEAYNFRLHARCVRFFELAALLEKKGFLPIDLVDVRHRPGDYLLWQMDIVFGRAGQKELQRCVYRA